MTLQQKELEFARRLGIENQLKYANGWVYRFKQRNGLQKVNFSGEGVKLIVLHLKLFQKKEHVYVLFWLNVMKKTFIMLTRQVFFLEWSLIKHLALGQLQGIKK